MKKVILVFLIVFTTGLIFAAKSYDVKKTNPDLKNMKVGFFLQELRVELPESWASSFLASDKSGKYAPDKITDYGPDTENGPGEALTGTAWVPGNGNGIGEVIIVNTHIPQNFRIFNGFGKSKELYQANNRPKEVTLFLLIAESADETKTGYTYKNIKVVAEAKKVLKDEFGYQYISISDFSNYIEKEQQKDPSKAIFPLLGLKINSIYKGTKYNDTCISDIGYTH